MAKKALKIEPIAGWFLICREEVPNDKELDKVKFGDRWYVGWLEPFGTRKSALAFARRNNWYAPFRAVRGHIVIANRTR